MIDTEKIVWKRYSSKQSLIRFIRQLAVLLVIIWALAKVDIYWPYLTDASTQAADLINRMFPPGWGYITKIIGPLIETINIATISTLLALVLAFPIAILNARNTTMNKVTMGIARTIVVVSRSVNELVWGLIFVVFFGPGALAGVAALTMRSLGFTAKLISEAIEEIDYGQVEAIEATGANKAKIFIFGILPQVMPTILGTAIFRWDINIRQSSIIGIVGAGGIGIILTGSMNLFRWHNVSMILIAIFAVVLVGEYVSASLRKKLL